MARLYGTGMLQSAASIPVSRAPARATAAAKPSFDLSFVRRFLASVQLALRASAEMQHLSPRRQRDVAVALLHIDETRERR
jgi:hypothetical protein